MAGKKAGKRQSTGRRTSGRRKSTAKRGAARRGKSRKQQQQHQQRRKPKKQGKARRRPSAKRAAARRPAKGPDLKAVGEIMHDITNLATAMRAYLELLESQGTFDARQRYYMDRTKQQVDQMVVTVQELRAKLPRS